MTPGIFWSTIYLGEMWAKINTEKQIPTVELSVMAETYQITIEKTMARVVPATRPKNPNIDWPEVMVIPRSKT